MSLKSAYSSQDDVPRTKLSGVAYFDMLGFSAQIKADKQRNSDVLLGRLKSTLGSWYEVFRDTNGGLAGQRFWELKAFTDNVVIGIPVQGNGEEQTLGQVLTAAALLQRGLTLEGGFFVRGGIAFGDLYIDDDICFGIGLLDAHEAEERYALVPRIVLAPSAAALIPGHARCYAQIESSPQCRTLLQDEDGRLFINYLSDVWDDDEEPRYDWLERHCELVSERLEEFRSDARIFSKYAWVARYHNYLCSLDPDAERYKVRLNFAGLAALRLSEIYTH